MAQKSFFSLALTVFEFCVTFDLLRCDEKLHSHHARKHFCVLTTAESRAMI